MTGSPDDPSKGLPGRPRGGRVDWRFVLFALVIAELSSAFEIGMIYVAIPTLASAFDSPEGASWLITIFLLVSSASAATCGRLGDLFGRRRLLLIVLCLAALGSLMSAVAGSSLALLLAGRGLQGLTGAILPLCIGLAREHLPQERVAVALGVLTAAASVGAGLGLLLSGYILDMLSWPWIFYFSMAVAIAGILIVPVWVPADRPRASFGHGQRFDLLGGLLFVPAISMVLLALSRSQYTGWLDILPLSLFCAGIVIFAVWVWYELRQANPLLNIRLFTNRHIALANACVFMFGAGALLYNYVLSLVLQQPPSTGAGLGLGAGLAGLLQQPAAYIALVGGPLGGLLCARFGGRNALIAGASIAAVSWIAAAFYHDAVWFLVLASVTGTLGLAMGFAAQLYILANAAPSDRTSEVIGMNSVIRSIAMAVGSQVLAVLIASFQVAGPGGTAYPAPMAYNLAFGYIGVATLVCMLLALAMPRQKIAHG